MQPLCFEWDSAGFVTPTNTGEDYTRYTMGLSICTSFFLSAELPLNVKYLDQ